MLFLSTLLISMFITMALIPILRLAAERWHCGLDVPDARKVHCVPVPKVGGLAMAAGALLPVLFVVDGGAFVNSVLIGAWIIVAFGVVDDFRDLGWKAKFAGQVIAALVVIYYGGLEICYLGACLPEGVRLHAGLGIPLTLLGFPVLDTLTDMVERIATGRMPFAPDKNHFHHKLMRLGFWHTESVVAIYAVTVVLVAAAYFLRFHSECCGSARRRRRGGSTRPC